MRLLSTFLVLGTLTTAGSMNAWAQGGTCGSCPSVGFCPPTFPMGAGPGEDHRCENHAGAFLVFADLTSANLSNIDLSGSSPWHALLPGAILTGANLSNTDLLFANVTNADLSNADLSNASLFGTVFNYSDLTGATFVGATFSADFSNAILTNVDFSGADFGNSLLFEADLTNADFSGATFGSFPDFCGADLSNAVGLSSTIGVAKYDCATIFTGTGFDPVAAGWILDPACGTCGSCPSVGFCPPTLPMGAAAGEDHTCEDHSGALLSGAVLQDAGLVNADLGGADLSNASLANARVSGAHFGGTDLSNTTGLTSTTGVATYDCATIFTGTGFDPVAAGWINLDCGTCVGAQEIPRLGTPPNPNAFLPGVTTPPILGATWDPVVDHTTFMPAAQVDFAGLSLTATNVLFPFGTLLCAPPIFGIQQVTPSTPFTFPIPSDCSLAGMALCCGAGSLEAGPHIQLTNALDITIGTY